jgi:hypothetical protein
MSGPEPEPHLIPALQNSGVVCAVKIATIGIIKQCYTLLIHFICYCTIATLTETWKNYTGTLKK